MAMGNVFLGVDEDISGNAESREGMMESYNLAMPTSFRSKRLSFHNNKVDVRTFTVVTAPERAEQDDLLRLDFIGDCPDHPAQERVGHWFP
ncbi:MAG: hypothetical protein OXI81_20045 [Paracoccaceae bacterium]|nr:hypothetical protein [Paracoccaceae bacterium]